MRRQVRVLRIGWEQLQRALGDPSPEHLAKVAMERGSAVLRDDPVTTTTDRSTVGRVDTLRSRVVLLAAAASTYRHRLVVGGERLTTAKEQERQTYEDGLALDRDRVPPLKLRAKALRAEIRRLEIDARSHGLDPDTIGPVVDWAETLAVDTFEPPRYESDADRKRAVVEFFRRLG